MASPLLANKIRANAARASAWAAAATAAAAKVVSAKDMALAALGPITNLALPPGYVDKRTVVSPFDKSPEAQFYGQLDKVADYIAAKAVLPATDTIDRNGVDHVNGAARAKTVAAIARAISLYMLNFPLSDVQAIGWKAMLTKILAMPMATWNSAQGVYIDPYIANIPMPWQLRRAGAWSVHPGYFAFMFWNDDLSFYRFVRYDATLGFTFTDDFKNDITEAIGACYWGPKNAIRIQDWINYRFGGPDKMCQSHGDYLYSVDPKSQWICDPMSMPATYTLKLQAAGNDSYSQEGHQKLMGYLSDAALIASIAFAGSALLASGLTWATGVQAVSVLESSPLGINNVGLKDILVVGKLVDLPSLVGDMSLDMSTAPELQPAPIPVAMPGPSLATIGVPAVTIDSSSFDPTAVDPSTVDLAATVDPSTIVDTTVVSPDVAINAATIDPTVPDLTVVAPDVPIVDPSTGVDMSAAPGSAVNIAPQDPATVTAADTATVGTDTSAVDNAQADAVTSATDSTGAFNLGAYVGAIAKIYAAVSVATKGGNAPSHVANRPTPGMVRHLPDGSTAVTNADGSTTITSRAGSVYTVLPSGKVVNGGAVAAGGGSLLLFGLLGIGALALLLNKRT